MQHVSLTPFGRQPMTAALIQARNLSLAALQAQTSDAPIEALEKWALFDDLRDAKARFGITDRDLAVLHALLSFLPSKVIKAQDNLVVFPSNATLCERAHGMAESTLRRHLAALVAAGLIWRQDSANGKRFAARDHRGVIQGAFGLDLRPLLLRALEIGEAADRIRQTAAQLQLARQHLVLALRDCAKLVSFGRLQAIEADWQAIEARLTPLRAALRRKMDLPIISQLQRDAQNLLGDISRHIGQNTENPSAPAAHSDCHLSESINESLDLEPSAIENYPQVTIPPNEAPTEARAFTKSTSQADTAPFPLALVLQACPDLQYYSPSQIQNWRDLLILCTTLHSMMGIPSSSWIEAQRLMGPLNAAITLAALLQRLPLIQNPGGYLRKLSAKASLGAYSPTGMIMSLLRPRPHQDG